MIAYTYIAQHSLRNCLTHTKLPHLGMLKDFDVIFRWIHWLVQSNLLSFVGFFHQSSMTVQQEVVTVVPVTGGIVATQERVQRMHGNRQLPCISWIRFWTGYAKVDFQHMFH